MTSQPVRDQVEDHLLTLKNAALLILDYQPPQRFFLRLKAASCLSLTRPKGSGSCLVIQVVQRDEKVAGNRFGSA